MTRAKATERLFPNFMPAATSLGAERLRAIAKTAKIEIDDLEKDDLHAIAMRLMERLPETGYFLHHVTHDDETKIAAALGILDEAAWKKANPVTDAVRAMPSYGKPSWQKDVWDAFQKKAELPPPIPRKSIRRDPQFAKDWLELASTNAWKKLTPAQKSKIAADLANALGKDFAAGKTEGLAVVHVPSAIEYAMIPGGKVSIGISKEEVAAIRKVIKGDPEGGELLKGYATQSKPVHDAQIPAFLCAKTPFLKSHAEKSGLAKDADFGNVHHVARMPGASAAALVVKLDARLLTESEWEWVARAEGARQWTVGGESPRDGIASLSSNSDMSKDLHPWEIFGLAWGAWVDDGWQPTYKKAPLDGSAFTPMEIPDVVRGGGLASWPWQSPGEAMLAHVAFRDRDRVGDQAVRVALDLPARKR